MTIILRIAKQSLLLLLGTNMLELDEREIQDTHAKFLLLKLCWYFLQKRLDFIYVEMETTTGFERTQKQKTCCQ